MELEKFTKVKLKELCIENGVDPKGTKAQLIVSLQLQLQSKEKNEPGLPSEAGPRPIPGVNCIWIASFDIGKNNFAFCIEEVDTHGFVKISKPPKGQMGPYKKEIIEKVYKNGKIIVNENLSITQGVKGSVFDPKLFTNMNRVLEKWEGFWSNCTHVIIEEQMSFGRQTNIQAVKLGQHCYSWFNIKYPDIRIVSFHAYHKTQVLAAPLKMTKPERKKWSVIEAQGLLEGRGDTESISKIEGVSKKDDLCDTIIQLQAYKVLEFYLK